MGWRSSETGEQSEEEKNRILTPGNVPGVNSGINYS